MVIERVPVRGGAVLVTGRGSSVGFLDAAAIGADDLGAAIDDAMGRLGWLGVLTVHAADEAAVGAVERHCRGRRLDLAATIRHCGRGVSFTIRRG